MCACGKSKDIPEKYNKEKVMDLDEGNKAPGMHGSKKMAFREDGTKKKESSGQDVEREKYSTGPDIGNMESYQDAYLT